jgi:regulator of sirC expression with transglutaminase-like and TPR domain
LLSWQRVDLSPTSSSDDLSLERAAFDVERDGFDLFRAACLMPRIEDRDPRVQECVEQVEAWGRTLRRRISDRRVASAGEGASDDGGDDARRAVVDLLFFELGFHGRSDDYDAPEHSFMADVLETKRGLPIALSLLTVAVAEAAGVRAFGVALPRHYVVGLGDQSGFVLIDPFHHGRVLAPADVHKLTGVSGLDVIGHAVSQTTPRATLMRMLANLHGSYLRRGERAPLVRVLSRMLLFEPRHPALLVQRAQVRAELLELDGALQDAETALGLQPDDDVRRAAEDMKRRIEDGRKYAN